MVANWWQLSAKGGLDRHESRTVEDRDSLRLFSSKFSFCQLAGRSSVEAPKFFLYEYCLAKAFDQRFGAIGMSQ